MRLSSRPDVLRLHAKQDIDGLVQALGYKADANIQKAASEALTAIGAPAVPALIHALASPDLQNPVMAILLNLGVLSIDPLINVIRTDTREHIQKSAVNILADIGMFAIEPLVATLFHPDAKIRALAVDALLKIGTLAVEPLVANLRNRNHPQYVRLDAVKALASLGGAQATSALLYAAQNDPSEEVKKSASTALGRQEEHIEPAAPVPTPVTPDRQRGLSQRFGSLEKRNGEAGLTDELKNRWPRVRQALPNLKPIPFDVIQRFNRSHAVHRRYLHPAAVVEDLNKEFSQYSRIKESAYADVSIRLVFDNEVAQDERIIPATRQLEVIIVSRDNQYYIFFNTTYIEYFW